VTKFFEIRVFQAFGVVDEAVPRHLFSVTVPQVGLFQQDPPLHQSRLTVAAEVGCIAAEDTYSRRYLGLQTRSVF